jgi:simple sugar transport system permease protein
MRIDLEARATRSALRDILAPVVALIIAMLIGGLIVALLQKSPLLAFEVYFVKPLSAGWSLQDLAVKASPLVLIATGLAFCFRANVWNIGAEGQFIAGGVLGSALALATHGATHNGILGGVWILPTMLVLGIVGGVLYAMIPALLRVYLGVSEILTSLMLVYVAQLGLDYLARGPWRDPEGENFPNSVTFDPEATLPKLTPDGSLHAGVLITFVAVVVASLVFSRLLFGYKVRLVGSAPRAARFAGFSDRALTIGVFAISGGLAGLAGICEVSGQINQLQTTVSPPPGYGFIAIIVAFLGRLSPIGILISGLVLALTYIGGEAAQTDMQLPRDLTVAFQGILLFCVLAADVFTRYRVRLTLWGAR